MARATRADDVQAEAVDLPQRRLDRARAPRKPSANDVTVMVVLEEAPSGAMGAPRQPRRRPPAGCRPLPRARASAARRTSANSCVASRSSLLHVTFASWGADAARASGPAGTSIFRPENWRAPEGCARLNWRVGGEPAALVKAVAVMARRQSSRRALSTDDASGRLWSRGRAEVRIRIVVARMPARTATTACSPRAGLEDGHPVRRSAPRRGGRWARSACGDRHAARRGARLRVSA